MAYIAVCFFNYATIPTLGVVWGVHFLEAKGITQSQATDVISFLWIGLAVGSPLMGAISDYFKNRLHTLWLVSSLGFVFTILLFAPFHHSVVLYGALFFCISCAASGQTLSFATLGELMPSRFHAVSFGINNTCVMLSGFIVPLVIGMLVQSFSVSLTLALIALPICFFDFYSY